MRTLFAGLYHRITQPDSLRLLSSTGCLEREVGPPRADISVAREQIRLPYDHATSQWVMVTACKWYSKQQRSVGRGCSRVYELDPPPNRSLSVLLQRYYAQQSLSTKVLSVSLNSVEEIMILADIDHITLPPPLLEKLARAPLDRDNIG